MGNSGHISPSSGLLFAPWQLRASLLNPSSLPGFICPGHICTAWRLLSYHRAFATAVLTAWQSPTVLLNGCFQIVHQQPAEIPVHA